MAKVLTNWSSPKIRPRLMFPMTLTDIGPGMNVTIST